MVIKWKILRRKSEKYLAFKNTENVFVFYLVNHYFPFIVFPQKARQLIGIGVKVNLSIFYLSFIIL